MSLREILPELSESVGSRRELKKGVWTPLDTFGVRGGWAASSPADDGSFGISRDGQPVGVVHWALQGEHNRLNALAAIAAASHAGVDPARAIEVLATFENVKRRMELRGTVRGVAVYDDFAHHPTAIRTTLEGLRRKAGRARIIAVLEPRSNTMKQGVMKAALPGSVAAADRVFVYAGGLGWDPNEVFSSLGEKVLCVDELGQLVDAIAGCARSGDQIVVMSNGGFGGIPEKLLERLAW